MKIAKCVVDAKTQAGLRLPGKSEMSYTFMAGDRLSIDLNEQSGIITLRTPEGVRLVHVSRLAELEPVVEGKKA
jgi:hypothetical protein